MSELTAQGKAIQRFFTTVGDVVARWTRLDYSGPNEIPKGPALLVANHGFGGIFDLNAFTIASLAYKLRPDPDAQITVPTHQLAWTLGVGPMLEPAGFRPPASTQPSKGLPPAITSWLRLAATSTPARTSATATTSSSAAVPATPPSQSRLAYRSYRSSQAPARPSSCSPTDNASPARSGSRSSPA